MHNHNNKTLNANLYEKTSTYIFNVCRIALRYGSNNIHCQTGSAMVDLLLTNKTCAGTWNSMPVTA